jgi:hypothetical protein
MSKSKLSVLPGQRAALHAEGRHALFRGLCLGDADLLERAIAIDACLSRRGQLTAVGSDPPRDDAVPGPDATAVT